MAHSIPATGVIEVVERLKQSRGLPEVIITDNGSEFRSRAFDSWAYARGVKLDFIQPGKPVQNGFIESFNGTLRTDYNRVHGTRSSSEREAMYYRYLEFASYIRGGSIEPHWMRRPPLQEP